MVYAFGISIIERRSYAPAGDYCLVVWLGRLCSACRVYCGHPVAYVCKRARTSPAAHSLVHDFFS